MKNKKCRLDDSDERKKDCSFTKQREGKIYKKMIGVGTYYFYKVNKKIEKKFPQVAFAEMINFSVSSTDPPFRFL